MKGGGWARACREWELLADAEAAFLWLANDALDVVGGGKPNAARWGQGSTFRATAKRAEEYAAEHPWAHPSFPDPLAELARAIDGFCAVADAGADGYFFAGLAGRYQTLRAVAGMRADAIGERERMEAQGSAEVARVRAELAKVKGDKAGYRKWKRKEGADVKRARLLEVYSLIYRVGMSVPQVAERMGVTSRSVERWLAEVRVAMGPAAHPLPTGRRKSVIADRRVGIDEAQRRALGGGRRGRGESDCGDGGEE